MNRKIHHGAWTYLFLALLALILVYPIFEQTSKYHVPWALSFFNSIVLLAIIYAASEEKRHFWLVFCCGAALLIMDWLGGEFFIELALRSGLYLYAIYIVGHHFIFSKKVSMDEVYGALSLYLLLGIFWATLFASHEHLFPGSFQNTFDKQPLTWSDFIYFSFVTLTTTGYGDIIPTTAFSRSLSIVEAISGLFCLGVLVSGTIGRIVAMSINEDTNP